MEPQDNKLIALRKAINAHQEAETSLMDLTQDGSGSPYSAMLERIRSNLRELHAQAESGDPAERV